MNTIKDHPAMSWVEKMNLGTAGLGAIVLIAVIGTLWNMNSALASLITASDVRAKYYEKRLDSLSHRQEVLEAEVYRNSQQ